MTPLAGLLRRSLPARLSAAFLTLSVTTLVLATTVSFVSAERALRRRTLDRLTAIAESDAQDLTFWVGRQRAALEYLARLPALRRSAGQRRPDGRLASEAAATTRLVLGDVPGDVVAAAELRLVAVPGGRVLFSTDSTTLDTFAVEELYFARGRDSTFTQRLYASSADGRPTLTVSTPVRDDRGTAQAVLAAHLDLADLEAVLLDVTGELPIDIYLVDRYAQFVSAERFGSSEYRRGVHSIGIDSALAGSSGAGEYLDYAGRPVVGVWRWIADQELALLVETPRAAAFAPARSLLIRSFIVGLVAAGLLTLGVVIVTRRATRPILALTDAAERVATGDFAHRAPEGAPDEIGRLSRSFNSMTAQLQGVYGELRAQVETTRAALAEARASRSMLQDLADNTTALVAVLDRDLTIRLANAQLEVLLDVPRGTAVGRPLLALIPPSATAALRDSFAALAAEDRPVVRELPLEAGGESHLWQVTLFPLRDAAGATYAFGLLAADLTARARAEEERRQHDASVQQAQKLESLGIMAGGIAHDFNNIMGAVLGNADLALGALDDPEEVRHALEQIAAAARRASDLTRQMLAYAGKASLRREVIDVRPLLGDVLALVKAAQSKKVEFAVAEMPAPLWIEIDSAQLSQVVLNLLTNAAEAIGDRVGTVSLSAARVTVADDPAAPGLDPTMRWIRLRVEDDGEGMSDEVKRRLFEPFYSTKRSGRGLGLSAVQGIIRSAGGALVLESTLGRGSRFDVYLPAAKAPARDARDAGRAAVAERRGLVLVIDDEEALRRVTRRALEQRGLEVIEAADGVEGLARFAEAVDAVDLVVLDMTMPGLGGAEVLMRLRDRRPSLPVIIASGYAESDQGTALPADPHLRYLQKPFGVRLLQRLVDELLP